MMFARFSAVLILSSCVGAGYAQSTYEGQYAAELTNTVPGAWTGDTALDINDNIIQVTPGSQVTLSFVMKSGNLGPSLAERVTIACFQGKDVNNQPTGFIEDVNFPGLDGTNPIPRFWKQYSHTFTLAANCNYVNIAFRTAAGGNPSHSLLIDNVSLATTAAPGTNLVGNGGFNTWTAGETAPPDGWRFFAVAGATGSIGRLSQIPAVGALPEMTNIFKVDAGTSVTPGALSWFNGDGTDAHNNRGMTFNPHTGNLLVVDRSSNTVGTVYVLSAATGAQIGVFNVSGATGGTFVVNKVGVDDSGRVFVANLALNGGPFKVYRYASEAAALTNAPVVAYEAPAPPSPGRWGDDFAVSGSGNSTKLLVAGRNHDQILILEDTDNDGTFSPTADSRNVAGVNGPGNVAFDTVTGKYWFHQSYSSAQQFDYELLPYNQDGSPAGNPIPLSIGYPTGAFAIAQIGGSKVFAVGPAEAENPAKQSPNIRGYLYKIEPDGTATPTFQTSQLGLGGYWYSNGNGPGDVAFDTVNRRVYFLATNNSISGWELPAIPTAAEDWQMFE